MTRRLIRLAIVAAIAVTVPAGAVGAAGATTSTSVLDAEKVVTHPVPALRFGCRVERVAGEPAVRCRWSKLQDRRVAGYVVYRARLQPSTTAREAIARVRQGQRPTVVDTRVRPGTVMAYAVVAVDRTGAPLQVSDVVRVKIPSGS